MAGVEARILQFMSSGFEYLFDLTSELVSQGILSEEEAPEDRVVAVFGRSQPATGKRDASRIRGFLGGPLIDRNQIRSDKGHFIGHSLGGDISALAACESTDAAFLVMMAGSASTLAEDMHYQCREIFGRQGEWSFYNC